MPTEMVRLTYFPDVYISGFSLIHPFPIASQAHNQIAENRYFICFPREFCKKYRIFAREI